MANLALLKKQVGQRIIIGFDGTEVPKELVKLNEEWGFGGFILFKRNLQNPEQIFSLNEALLALDGSVPPFIGIDQEGGAVSRLPDPFTQIPAMSCVGHAGTVSMAYEVGAIIGRELNVAGFNLNFAPVLDINLNTQSPVIGNRAISSDPAVVSLLSKALIQGLHDNSVIACGKHFPGHGDTTEDSHLTLPTCKRTERQLQECEFKPYYHLIQEHDVLDMTMLSHVLYPNLDPEYPASLSMTIQQDFLRAEVGFRGVSVSDDFEMKAITDNYSMEEMTHLAFEAGLDLFLVCHTLEKQMEVLETLVHIGEQNIVSKSAWEAPIQRIVNLKRKRCPENRTIDRVHASELIGAREHSRIARRLRDGK